MGSSKVRALRSPARAGECSRDMVPRVQPIEAARKYGCSEGKKAKHAAKSRAKFRLFIFVVSFSDPLAHFGGVLGIVAPELDRALRDTDSVSDHLRWC